MGVGHGCHKLGEYGRSNMPRQTRRIRLEHRQTRQAFRHSDKSNVEGFVVFQHCGRDRQRQLRRRVRLHVRCISIRTDRLQLQRGS